MPTMTACPDASTDALSAAITDKADRLHALAVRVLGDHHAAQDAVQDACVRALVALDRYRGDASMGTWLYRITTNVCLDEPSASSSMTAARMSGGREAIAGAR